MTDPTDTVLGEHEGREVIATTIEVRKVGGGLHDPLAIDPEVIHIGDERVLCLPVRCVDVGFVAEKRAEPGEGGVVRSHVFDATAAFFIDPTLVAEARIRQAEKVVLKQRELDRAKRAGKTQGGTVGNPDQVVLGVDEVALEEAHLANEHAGGLVEGCPSCDWEHTLEANEAEAGDES